MDYRQVRVIAGKGGKAHQFEKTLRGLALDRNDHVFAAGDSAVKVFGGEGQLVRSWHTASPGFCVSVAGNGNVYVGEAGQLEIFDPRGKPVKTWKDPQRLGRVTAIAVLDECVLVADAGDRCLRRFSREGEFLNDIGKDNRMKGFLIPNGVLDFAVDDEQVIHATNPGKHRIERYTLEGEYLGRTGRFDGRDPEGFSGCCNPTNIALDARDRVYVTEKAGPRAKVYDREGKLLAIVATQAFDPSCKNMDLVVDSKGRVYVADTVRLQICMFAPEAKKGASDR